MSDSYERYARAFGLVVGNWLLVPLTTEVSFEKGFQNGVFAVIILLIVETIIKKFFSK